MLVSQLARKLGKTSAEVVALLRADGEWVHSHRSRVPDPALRRYLSSEALEEPDQPLPALPPRPQALAPPAAPSIRPPRAVPRRRGRPGPRPLTFQRPAVSNEWDDWDDPIDRLRSEPILTTRDAAALLRVTPGTIRQWVRRGYITPSGSTGPSHTFATRALIEAYDQILSRRRSSGDRSLQEASRVRRVPYRDREALITTAVAADLAQVSPSTIRSWVHRGRLVPAATGDQGRPLYRVQDVINVATTRHLPSPRRLGRAP